MWEGRGSMEVYMKSGNRENMKQERGEEDIVNT